MLMCSIISSPNAHSIKHIFRDIVFKGPEAIVLALQVHLTYVNASSVVVSWATGNGTFVNGPLSVGNVTNPYGPYSTVNVTSDSNGSFPVSFGRSSTSLNNTATGQETTYAQIYTGVVLYLAREMSAQMTIANGCTLSCILIRCCTEGSSFVCQTKHYATK